MDPLRLLPVLLICCVNCLHYPPASTLVQGAFMLGWILTQAFKVSPNKWLLPQHECFCSVWFWIPSESRPPHV